MTKHGDTISTTGGSRPGGVVQAKRLPRSRRHIEVVGGLEPAPNGQRGVESMSDLTTLENIRDYVRCAYQSAVGGAGWLPTGGPLSPEVAEPAALMSRAVEVAGPAGLTIRQLRDVFDQLGKERFDSGLARMRRFPEIVECKEMRANKAGWLQAQVVLRASTAAGGVR
jgi:hypothetical protein